MGIGPFRKHRGDLGRSSSYSQLKRQEFALPETPMISIVDDDQAVRNATKALVRSLGYRAATFSSAEEFLGSERLHDTSCLISDLHAGFERNRVAGPARRRRSPHTHDLHHGISGRPHQGSCNAFRSDQLHEQALQRGEFDRLSRPGAQGRLISGHPPRKPIPPRKPP